jgi:hypothetical protein
MTPDPLEIEHFKNSQLGKIVMDEPWDTSLAWSDAQGDLLSVPLSSQDREISRIFVEFLDEGFAYFFRVTDFGESYRRTPTAAEVLSRAELEWALGDGRESPIPFLGVRATEAGREEHFRRYPLDRDRWDRGRFR